MTTTAGSKFSAMSTKLQVGTAAVAVAAAAAITPAVAHAAPSLAPFSTNVGNSAELLLDSVVITPGSNKKASASATPTPGQIIIGGYGQSLNQAIGATVFAIGFGLGSIVAITGNVISILLPSLGQPITALGENIIAASYTYAQDHGIGPYGT